MPDVALSLKKGTQISMKKPVRVHYKYNDTKTRLIVFLRRRGWGYQDIADGLLNEYGIRNSRQNIRNLYKKYYRKFSKGELDTFEIPEKL